MSSKAKAIAVFDISSSSVGGAHALIERGDGEKNSVNFLVQERRDSGLEEELNIERFVEDTAKALEVVISHVRTADVHHPEFIQVVLSSPWYNAYTRTITYTKLAPFTCTKRLVNSLIEKEIDFLLKQPAANGAPFGEGFKVVEQQLSQVLLNGYESSDPYGKKAESLELTLTVTLTPEIVVERFTSIIRRSYGDRTINVTTGPHAAFVALRDNGGIEANSVIIDVGEEVTDVAFVKNGLFLSQHSFPVGTYELYHALSASTGSTLEARALVEGYRLAKLSPNSMRIVEKSLQSFSESWIQALRTIVEQGQVGFHFPSYCYVCADNRFETIFTTLVMADPYLKHNTVSQDIQALFVDVLQLSANVKNANSEHVDTALLLGALFSERLL
jgi:hypothetical protein